MNEYQTLPASLAVIADVHGNRWALEAVLQDIDRPVILCGHSHVPRTISLPQGKLIINPGSVGLLAHTMETPIPYAMESGSPMRAMRFYEGCSTAGRWSIYKCPMLQSRQPWQHIATSVMIGHTG